MNPNTRAPANAPNAESLSTAIPRLLLTTPEAAEALAISPRKLWELTNRGEIPFLRIGKLLRYSPDVLRDWIARQHTEQT